MALLRRACLRPRAATPARWPRLRRAAVIALQLCSNYWLFFYVAWFAPLALVAMLGAYRPRARGPRAARRAARRARRQVESDPAPQPPRPGTASRRARGGPAERQPVGALTIERPAVAGASLVVALFSATLLLSAGLVFLVQPMFARFALPLLGGAPAVWTTAMLFFQTVLLLSYLYAHWSIARFGARRQAALHLALVASALFLLPIGIPNGWTPPVDGLAGALAAADDARHRRPAVLRGLGDRAAAPELARGHRPPRCPRPLLPLPREQHRQRRRPAELPAAGRAAADARRPELAVVGRLRALMLLLVACALVLWRSRRPRPEPEEEQAAAGPIAAGKAAALGGARVRPVEPDAGRDGESRRPTWRRSRCCGCCRSRSISRRS